MVRDWLRRAGNQAQALHEQVIGRGHFDLEQVQADEIKVKTQRGTIWMAMAVMVRSRLWLGGVISPHRDLALIVALVSLVRAIARCRPLLLAVAGLSSYVRAFQDAFRSPLLTGQPGRPRLVAWPDIAIRSSGQTAQLQDTTAAFCPSQKAGQTPQTTFIGAYPMTTLFCGATSIPASYENQLFSKRQKLCDFCASVVHIFIPVLFLAIFFMDSSPVHIEFMMLLYTAHHRTTGEGASVCRGPSSTRHSLLSAWVPGLEPPGTRLETNP